MNVADNEVVLNSDWDASQVPTQNAGITINRGLYTNAFIRYDESNGYWVLRDNVEQYIIATTANVGSGLISAKSAYEANVGFAIAQGQANVGAGLISVTSAYEANIGAARIADVASGQANVGAGLISVTNAYQANVGQLRIDTNTANSALSANIGAARIADTTSGQANVGEAKIISLGRADSAFGQANLAFDKANSANNLAQDAYNAANTATTSGGARAFDQANLAFHRANSAWEYANSAYATANNEILTRQANVGEAVITITGAYQANVGAGLISTKSAYEANVGAGLISVTNAYQANVGQLRLDTSNANTSLAANIGAARIADVASGQANTGAGLISLNTSLTNAYQANVGQLRLDTSNANTSLAANIGAARIADQASSQANVGAGLITVTNEYQANTGAGLISLNTSITNAYQANVGQLRLDAANDNTSLAANIGAARIADVAAGQANVGAGLITVTSAYQANVGAAKIIALGRADSAFAQANLAFDAANSAFAQANLAYAAANSKLSSSGGTISGDLAVTGNLTITGNTTTINVASLSVTDTLIQLGTQNQTDLLDIGFVGHYANTPNNHTGLIRKFTDGRYYLFDNLLSDTETPNIVDIANTRVATLSANLVTNVITLRGLDPLDYANTIQTSAQANVGAGLITKVNKSGDVMTGALTTSSILTGSSLVANTTVTVNTNALIESTAVTTSSTAQITLDSFATATYRSGKYLVQMTSGSSYHMIELSLIHDNTTVYLSQYGEVKSGTSLGTFDASISTGTLSVLFTPTNAITTAKAVATLIPV